MADCKHKMAKILTLIDGSSSMWICPSCQIYIVILEKGVPRLDSMIGSNPEAVIRCAIANIFDDAKFVIEGAPCS